MAAGTETLTLDRLGLTDSIGAHLEPPAPTRPGHEKVVPLEWFWARYGGDLTDAAREAGATDVDVADARRALSCSDAQALQEATEDPLSWSRFWTNVGQSFALTSMRIPTDPVVAAHSLC